MDTDTSAPTLGNLAQELVELTRTIRQNQERVAELKRLITSEGADSPIECTGGRVIFVQSTEVRSLDRETLIQLVTENSMLSRSDIESFIDQSRLASDRAPYVLVRLN